MIGIKVLIRNFKYIQDIWGFSKQRNEIAYVMLRFYHWSSRCHVIVYTIIPVTYHNDIHIICLKLCIDDELNITMVYT